MMDADQQEPDGGITDGGRQEPGGERTEADSQNPTGEITDADLHHTLGPFDATTDAEQQPPAYKPSSKPAASPTYTYAVMAAGAGILFGVAFAANFWRTSSPTGPYDLGSATSSANGLKGHLLTTWDKEVEYRLTIGPGDQGQQAGFALAISNPPRPLSFDIQLKNSLGFVLCSTNILLKYDPGNAGLQAGNANASNDSGGQIAQGADTAQLEAQELARERGKDILQNQFGPDGQIEAINSQGEIPCSKEAYQKAVSWSFSTNFPTLDEQTALLKRQAEIKASAIRLSHQTTVARRKARLRATETPLRFSVEGYDVVSWSDASTGVIGTEGGKTFVIDKAGNPGNAAAWQVYPANIHYKCDQNAVCTITRADSVVVLHARLRR